MPDKMFRIPYILILFWFSALCCKKDDFEPSDMEIVIEVIKTQFLYILPALALTFNFENLVYRPTAPTIENSTILDSGWLNEFLFLVFCSLFQEISYYFIHRAMHHSRLFSIFHKQHHSYHKDIGINAIYASPFEVIVADMVPILTPLLIFPHLWITSVIWLTLAVTTTVRHHSKSFDSEFHNNHHKYVNCNYGLFFMDYLCGTSK